MSARRSVKDQELLAPENFVDPYDAMTDEEFEAYTRRLFGEPAGASRSVTLRMPQDLLSRLQRIADSRHVPYQRLMRRMLEESVSALERRGGPQAGRTRRPRGSKQP